MVKLALNFAVDVSGQPYETVYLGLISVKTFEIDRLIKNFKKTYPKFSRSKQKGAKRSAGELKSIMKFLDEHKVHMTSICFKSKDWLPLKERYKNKAFFIERIFGVLYFMLLKEIGRRGYSYPVTMCTENYMNTDKALQMCKKLAKANKYEFILSTGYSNTNELIRLADFVAASHRKIKERDLKRYKYFKIIKENISLEYIKKVFT